MKNSDSFMLSFTFDSNLRNRENHSRVYLMKLPPLAFEASWHTHYSSTARWNGLTFLDCSVFGTIWKMG